MTVSRISSQLVGVLDVYIQHYTSAGALTVSLGSAAITVASIPTVANPNSGWYLMGATDGEQAVSHGGGLTYFRDNLGTGPTKAVRPEEDVTVTFTVVGLSLQNYVYILSGGGVTADGYNTVDTGTATVEQIGLGRGLVPGLVALILRGKTLSPHGNFRGQYVFPMGVLDGEPNPTYSKDGRAELEVEFHALEDESQTPAKRMGWLEVKTS